MSLVAETRSGTPVTTEEFECQECSFALWRPVAILGASRVGLYDDDRFPGRLIVSLSVHFDHFDELPPGLVCAFMEDVQWASTVLKRVVGANRVNIAILGNKESHVHAHLIPRQTEEEPLPHKSPWQDPRPARPLSRARQSALACELKSALMLGQAQGNQTK